MELSPEIFLTGGSLRWVIDGSERQLETNVAGTASHTFTAPGRHRVRLLCPGVGASATKLVDVRSAGAGEGSDSAGGGGRPILLGVLAAVMLIGGLVLVVLFVPQAAAFAARASLISGLRPWLVAAWLRSGQIFARQGRLSASREAFLRWLHRGMTVPESERAKRVGAEFVRDGERIWIHEVAPGRYNVVIEDTLGKTLGKFRRMPKRRLEKMNGWKPKLPES